MPSAGQVRARCDAGRSQQHADLGTVPDCQVEHQPYVQSGVAQGHMRVVNDGKGCGFNFRFAGKFDPSSWKVEQPPQHGRVEAGGSRVEYFPEAGYAGPDAFTVAVFGVNPMMRTREQVARRPLCDRRSTFARRRRHRCAADRRAQAAGGPAPLITPQAWPGTRPGNPS